MEYSPDVTWVHELVRRKRRPARAEPTALEDASATAISTARAQLWQEIIAAVAAYNEAFGREEIVATFSPNGDISLAKHDFPAGYLDVRPDHAAARFIVTVKLRKTAAAPLVEYGIEGGWVVRDGQIHLVWFGVEMTPAEIVRRILTPFFDEI